MYQCSTDKVVLKFIRMTFVLKHPFTCIVAGPTSCGKTVFTRKFLENINLTCNVKFNKIHWYYDEWQENYKDLPEVIFMQGTPNMESYNGRGETLIILDDLMREVGSTVVDIFTKGSHHRNLSVIYITQNLFHQAKGQRDISLNANYIIYFKNPRDRSQIMHLARQVFPENIKFIQEAYSDATTRPHGYLLFDLKQATPEKQRFLTNILPDESPAFAYIPKKKSIYK